MMAGLSVMAFDSPGSSEMWPPWAFVIAIWSYPVWLLLAAIVAWTLYGCRRPILAVIVCGLVTLPIPVVFLLIAVSANL